MNAQHAKLVPSMNLPQMLTDLRAEQRQIEEAILVLQRLAATGGKRRGRPPKWMASAKDTGSDPPVAKRKRFTIATRKKMAAAQRRRWAERRAEATR
jgi:hypothetical protein